MSLYLIDNPIFKASLQFETVGFIITIISKYDFVLLSRINEILLI